MTTYRVFIRSATDWESFATARKRTVRKGLTLEEAREFCRQWNADRSDSQKRNGTKAEFDATDG